MQLDLVGIAVSLGSACASGSTRPSPTLLAMRIPDDRLRSSVRFSLARPRRRLKYETAISRVTHVISQNSATEVFAS